MCWCRSQNKETLIKCETFSIIQYIGEKEYRIANDIIQGLPLATYSTKEKALKVLDMLEERFNHLNWQNVYKNSLSEYSNDIYRDLVFQFPLDSEVE
jgi:phospholipid N-methyltransferase